MHTAASAIDPERREVRCRNGGATGYDLLSIDIGSSPPTAGVPGAGEHALALKPARRFI
jgi:selenide, water dikinase